MSYSGKQWSTHRYSIQDAKPSFSHRWVHHSCTGKSRRSVTPQVHLLPAWESLCGQWKRRLPWWPSFRTTDGRARVRPPKPPTAWTRSRSSSGRWAAPSLWKTEISSLSGEPARRRRRRRSHARRWLHAPSTRAIKNKSWKMSNK